ncbi:MAG: Uma2 family endonuclease [Labilithrix sp.]|nr:Uma2 family endonuclease [Labilithrix sp.]MCW5812028.1 Uma2 family endonuclease [Labilithrix sp.]
MSQGSRRTPHAPDTSHLITDDGAPVDSWLAEKQMRLLTGPLYAGWRPGRPFVVAANVGVFAIPKNPALVPDVFVSVDVSAPQLSGPDRLNSYFVWEFGKPPDVVIEIVSDTPGGELSDKLRDYERMRVPYYAVYDPLRRLRTEELLTFSLDGGAYALRDEPRFDTVGLSLRFWEGVFEGIRFRWLRWADLDGHLIPIAEEDRAQAEEAKAQVEEAKAQVEEAKAQVEEAKARVTAAEERNRALEARLRALGIEPEG